jgi:hypothetical protein
MSTQIVMANDYAQINNHIANGHNPISNVHKFTENFDISDYMDIDMSNSFHLIKLGQKTPELLSVQNVWYHFASIFMLEKLSARYLEISTNG